MVVVGLAASMLHRPADGHGWTGSAAPAAESEPQPAAS
jgi:hypothetical protein